MAMENTVKVSKSKYEKMLEKLKKALENETPESYNAWFDKIHEFETKANEQMEDGTLDLDKLEKEYNELFNYRWVEWK